MLAGYTTVERELRTRVRGECFFDERTRNEYSTAACWYRVQPVGVVFPRDTEDVQAVARFCRDNDIPLIARGAATGLAGQAIGMGIILDFTKHMNRVIRYDGRHAIVEPGVVLANLNAALAPSGTFFPIDPASGELCTVGGMIATNAAGAHGLKYGATKDHVVSLEVVLADGSQSSVASYESQRDVPPSFLPYYRECRELLLNHRDIIVRSFPRVEKNSSGYNLLEAISGNGLDATKLLTGSEGTLAVITAATLRILPRPECRLGLLAYFSDYESTADATVRARLAEPSAVEILDRTYFMLGMGADPKTDALINPQAKAMLYFEFDGMTAAEVRNARRRLLDVIASSKPMGTLSLDDDSDRTLLWKLREEVSKKLNLGKEGGKTSFVEDVAVPVEKLPQYLTGLAAILSRFGISFSLYGHAAVGNIHCGTFVDLRNPAHYRAIDLIASEVYDLAIELGGTLSGEHGDGFLRTPFLERLYGPQVYNLFRKVKNIFDPTGILNPGKIVGKQNATILHDLAIA